MSEMQGNTEIKMGSERSFGLVFAVVFLIIALFPLPWGGSIRWWALAIAAILLAIGYLKPRILAVPNRLWFRFGLLLNKVMSPIIMGIVFFGTVTPIGLIRRMRNPDPLNNSFDPACESYWSGTSATDESQTSMRKQF
ncbi:MAG: SxtJ family membrane protein [Pseudomonadota bacterium]